MKHQGKRLAWLLAVSMLATSVPAMNATPVFAEESVAQIQYRNPNGSMATCNTYEVISTQTTLGTVGEESWYVVNEDCTISDRVIVAGNVNVILCDGVTWTAQNGIRVSAEENSFTIWAQSEGETAGSLIASVKSSAYYACAGIGGEYSNSVTLLNGENITINGGNITASSYGMAAGIGSVHGTTDSYARNITINAGHVRCYGTEYSPGLGAAGGEYFASKNYCDGITINGGIVEAYGDQKAPGIGAGSSTMYSSTKNITINGGIVYSQGGEAGPGIGSGVCKYRGCRDSITKNITINGGRVVAIGKDGAPAIGSAYYLNLTDADNRSLAESRTSNIVITGGSVYLEGADGADSEAIAYYTENHPDLLPLLQPVEIKNANGDVLHCMDVHATNCETAVKIDSTVGIGSKNMTSDEEGYVYLWGKQSSFVFPTTGNTYLDQGFYYSISGATLKAVAYTGKSTYTMSGNQTIAANRSLNVLKGTTLTIPKGKTLTVQGQLNANGTIKNSGTIVLAGGTYEDLSWIAKAGKVEITGGEYKTSPAKYLKLGYQAKKVGSYYVVSKIVRKKGDKIAVGNLKVQIVDANKKTVAFYGVKTTTITSLTIPATVSIDGQTYKVVGLNSNAFKACTKLKTITIKTTLLTSGTVSSSAFTGLGKGVTIKVPKSKLTTYKKLFISKKLNSKVTVKGY